MGGNCSPGSSQLYRLGVSQAQKAKVSGDERPRPNFPFPLFPGARAARWRQFRFGQRAEEEAEEGDQTKAGEEEAISAQTQ